MGLITDKQGRTWVPNAARTFTSRAVGNLKQFTPKPTRDLDFKCETHVNDLVLGFHYVVKDYGSTRIGRFDGEHDRVNHFTEIKKEGFLWDGACTDTKGKGKGYCTFDVPTSSGKFCESSKQPILAQRSDILARYVNQNDNKQKPMGDNRFILLSKLANNFNDLPIGFYFILNYVSRNTAYQFKQYYVRLDSVEPPYNPNVSEHKLIFTSIASKGNAYGSSDCKNNCVFVISINNGISVDTKESGRKGGGSQIGECDYQPFLHQPELKLQRYRSQTSTPDAIASAPLLITDNNTDTSLPIATAVSGDAVSGDAVSGYTVSDNDVSADDIKLQENPDIVNPSDPVKITRNHVDYTCLETPQLKKLMLNKLSTGEPNDDKQMERIRDMLNDLATVSGGRTHRKTRHRVKSRGRPRTKRNRV